VARPGVTYTVFVFYRERFLTPLPLPAGYRYVDEVDREAAVRLLAADFAYLADDESELDSLWTGAVGVAHGPELIGAGFLSPNSGTDFPAFARADYLVVHRGHRTHGIARPLIAEIMRRAAAQGYPGLIAETNRPRVERLYLRIGDEVVGHRHVEAPSAGIKALVRPLLAIKRRLHPSRAKS